MSSYLALANEKLLFANLLLQHAAGTHPSHLVRALLQSALLHLEIAYRHHLREIAGNYSCRNIGEIQDVAGLIRALEAGDKHPAEATEMLDLESRPQSWLAQALLASKSLRLGNLGRVKAAKKITSRPDLIPSQQLPDDQFNTDALSTNQVQDWLQKLREMIHRHRETMFEC